MLRSADTANDTSELLGESVSCLGYPDTSYVVLHNNQGT